VDNQIYLWNRDSVSLCLWEKHLMLFSTLGPSSLPVVVASLTTDMQTEQLLCWSGMISTEHSTTSGSKENL